MMNDYIEVGKDKAVKLEEYNGVYSLSQHRNYNGKWYWQEVKMKIGKDSIADKFTPQKVLLGDKETALNVLKQIYAEIAGSALEDDTPF
jgi:hypothetical protein